MEHPEEIRRLFDRVERLEEAMARTNIRIDRVLDVLEDFDLTLEQSRSMMRAHLGTEPE